MGQEQSLESLRSGSVPPSDGVTLVQGTGSSETTTSEKGPVEELLEKSASLPLPQQLLPPPAVKDDFSSALQGAQVMHDLRSALGGLLLGIEESSPARALQQISQGDQEKADQAEENVEKKDAVSEIVGDLNRAALSIDEFSMETLADTRAEQLKWARLGIDEAALRAVIDECTGGQPLTKAMERQQALMDRIVVMKEHAGRLRKTVNKNKEDARKTTLALERLDRIHVSLSDVQESLESAVATANILGASHFAHDDEMCSFKNFLKHNPPRDV